jgi:hypothetical protein
VRIVFLDVDGVLNRTGYRPVESLGLRSWIEAELGARLSTMLAAIDACVVMSSDWRIGRTLPQLDDELRAAGVVAKLVDVTPQMSGPRWREIEAWLSTRAIDVENVAIIDDGFDMGALQHRFVRVSPLTGLDDDAAERVVTLFV